MKISWIILIIRNYLVMEIMLTNPDLILSTLMYTYTHICTYQFLPKRSEIPYYGKSHQITTLMGNVKLWEIYYGKFCYGKCHLCETSLCENVVIGNVINVNVIMENVILKNVIMGNDLVPDHLPPSNEGYYLSLYHWQL